ncbi:YraN family protein [Polaribacter sargassicola]|uniref:YraN family protein n=1 Tax=Polaribacter sargassicola TaxID=2836891 RepID=UPI001F22A9AB|nr:YraN family protein [Polaribacter sp. DS7-9]MCG1035169.1 YraN family protein [Polaribacter sp. DS7-9]
MAEHNKLGEKGEQLAIDFLIKNDYKILEKNYCYLKAEVDIIAQKEEVLAVVEVKTRSTDYFGNPEDFVNPKKIKLLLSAIDYYVIENDLDVEVRFDIIAIIHQKKETKIKHLKDAFLHF